MKTLLRDLAGPTSVHLQHEAYLLASLTLLTIASFQSVYQESFGLRGDLIFITLTSAWLSRYLAIRSICTWDISTSVSPTLRGVLAHLISSHLMHLSAGQYFDRPTTQLLAKQGIGVNRLEEEGRNLSFIMPSICYAWNFFRVRLLFPLQRKYEFLQPGAWQDYSSSESSRASEDTGSQHLHHSNQFGNKRKERDASYEGSGQLQLRLSLGKISLLLGKIHGLLGPALQMSIPVCTLIYYTMNLPRFTDRGRSAADTPKMDRPPWTEVLFFISFPTIASLLFFSRLMNPIPDLVAGSNALKAVRNEAKTFGSVTGKSSKSRIAKEHQDGPWAEQNKSVITANRLRLIACIVLIRVIENIYVAFCLPLTLYACRATGHCREGVHLWQLSTILYPSQTSKAMDYYNTTPDWPAAVFAAVSVIIVSAILLLGQAVTLNNSFLAITAFICSEWAWVDPQKDPSFKNASVGISQWDPKRRYKKGDMIVIYRNYWYPRQIYYKAISNSPEGRPFEFFLRATHDMFRNELGHPSTSEVLKRAGQAHLVFIAVLTLTVLCNAMVRGNNSNGMLTTLIANIIACFGSIRVGLTNRSEIHRMSQEIRI